jgi:hypothetical protein
MPYKMGSESAKDLARVLNVMRVHPDGEYVPKIGHVVINWGTGRTPDWMPRAAARSVRVLNNPSKVSVAGNKLSALQALSSAGVAVPQFTTNTATAEEWVRSGSTVVERHELRGNSGAGIRIVNLDDQSMASNVTYAPLYTKFIPKTAEFRVHVFRGEVIDYIEKKKKLADNRPANFNKYVSSINLGWVFSRTDVRDMPEVRQIAIQAVAALGLDFGAVDIVFYEGRPYVLEVNTAPGVSGTTLVKYANAFRRYMGASDLSASEQSAIIAQSGEVQQTRAATTASVAPSTAPPVSRPVSVSPANLDEVVLKLDRATALKLKALLASVSA